MPCIPTASALWGGLRITSFQGGHSSPLEHKAYTVYLMKTPVFREIQLPSFCPNLSSLVGEEGGCEPIFLMKKNKAQCLVIDLEPQSQPASASGSAFGWS